MVIAKDPNSGDDDGTREVTPIIPLMSTTKLRGSGSPIILYKCKVIDMKGKGTSAEGSVTVTRV